MPKQEPLTEKQEQVKSLLENGQTVEEVAELMDSTPRAINAQVSRIHSRGHFIRTRRDEAEAGPLTVEAHIESELQQTTARLEEIADSIAKLSEEQTTLQVRSGALSDAGNALRVSTGKPRLAAVS